MDKETNKLLRELGQKLDIVIALLLYSIPKNTKTPALKERVRLLHSLKIRPMDISKITGRTQGHVNKELASIRKEK